MTGRMIETVKQLRTGLTIKKGTKVTLTPVLWGPDHNLWYAKPVDSNWFGTKGIVVADDSFVWEK